MSLEGVVDKLDYAVFARLGNSEPRFVNDYVEKVKIYVKDKYDFDLAIVESSDLGKLVLESAKTGKRVSNLPYYTKDKHGKIGMLMRQCTYEYKILHINRWIRKNINPPRGKVTIERWFGISFEERQRMKYSSDKWAINHYPLVEMGLRRGDNIEYLNRIEELKNPPSSSCVFCPFHSDIYWSELKKQYPEEFQRAVEFDKLTRTSPRLNDKLYLHKSCLPLGDIEFGTQEELFEGCDEGYCGI